MAPQTGYLEREVNFKTDLAFELPDLREVVGRSVRQPDQEVRTAYFDTSDLRLWHQGITLRYRFGDRPDAGTWTAELPAGTGGATLERRELSWPGRVDTFPPEATDLLGGLVRRATLAQVVELQTTRTRFVFEDPDGVAWGELDSDIVTVVGGHRDGSRFRQLELETAIVGHPAADDVRRRLLRAGARLDNVPKFAKALGLPTGRDAERDTLTVDPDASLGAVVRVSIAGNLDRLLNHDYRLRLDPEDPDPHDIHQARVATRRLRSDLKTFAVVIDPVWSDHTRAGLRTLGEVFGEVRDADVLASNLREVAGELEDDGGLDELWAGLDRRRRTASLRLAEMLAGGDYLNLLDRLHAAALLPPFFAGSENAKKHSRVAHPDDRAEQVLPSIVAERWRRLRKRARPAGHPPSDRELHRIRIAAKELRYAAEAAVPVIGKRARRTANAAEHLQTVLGEHHDAVAANEWLREWASGATATASFAAGRLSAAEERRKQTAVHQWPSIFDRLARKKARRWLR